MTLQHAWVTQRASVWPASCRKTSPMGTASTANESLVVYIAAIVIVPAFIALGIYMVRQPDAAHRSIWFASEKPPNDWIILAMRVTGICAIAVTGIFAVMVMASAISK